MIWNPNIEGKADPKVVEAIRYILNGLRDLQSKIPQNTVTAAQLKAATNIAAIRDALQAGGVAPINITNLLGIPAQASLILTDTHANRLANFPAASQAIGTAFIESDRKYLYVIESVAGVNTWVYVAGVSFNSQANRYADLGSADTGALYWSTDYLQLSEWNGTSWVILLSLPMTDLHVVRYATGTVDTTNVANSVVTWATGSKFSSTWVGRHIVVNGTRCTVTVFTSDTSITVDTNLGAHAGVTYYAGYFSVDLVPGIQFFETDRQQMYIVDDVTGGTVTPNHSAIAWTSGNKFSPTWVGSSIVINGTTYPISAVTSTTALTITGDAGTPGAVSYSVAAGQWLYVSGVSYSTLANIGTDYTLTDVGALWQVTDYGHLLEWAGTGWQWGPGEMGSAYILMGQPDGSQPNNGSWGLCDGSTYAVLGPTGVTSNITTRNLTGDVFIKGGAVGAPQAATVPTWQAGAKTDNAVTGITINNSTTGISVSVDSHGTAADTTVTGAGTRLTSPVTHTATVTDPGHNHGITEPNAGAGSSHNLSNANAKLNAPSEANGGLPLRINVAWFIRR